MDMVNAVFLPVDADVIQNIPLSVNWHEDRIIWHYSSTGELMVMSAYYFVWSKRHVDKPTVVFFARRGGLHYGISISLIVFVCSRGGAAP